VAETLNGILTDLGTAVTEFAPRLLGAAIVMLLALAAAFALRRLCARLLESLGLDALFERAGVAQSLYSLGYGGGPSRLLGLVVFWVVLLTGVAGALSALGLSSLEATMDNVVNLAGRALVALVIALAGVTAAGRLAGLVADEAESAGLRGTGVLRRVVFATLVTVTGLLAANQLGLETGILIIIAVVLLSTIGLVAAVALGGGLVTLSANIAASSYVREGISAGDEISVNGVEGTVTELSRAAVVVRSEDGYLYRIPNRTLLENTVRKKAS
jgi:small-conductance mechanosensitive channel